MESVKLPAIDYAALAPMLILFGVACVGVIVEATVPRRSRHGVQLGLAQGGKVLGRAAERADAKRRRGTPGPGMAQNWPAR